MTTQIFINLPVTNLNKSMAFFSKLGFKFNPIFTDKNAACMIISKDIFSMLIVKKYFKTFTKKKISDATKTTEVLLALRLESKQQVNAMVNKALKAGGTSYMQPKEYPFMYQRNFADLDGHQWEIFHMDMKKFPKKK